MTTFIHTYRTTWLFSNFLTVLQHLSKEDSRMNDLAFLNNPCFSAALKEITKRCQSILSEQSTHSSTSTSLDEQSPPNSLVFTHESHLSTTIQSESTSHSTQNDTPLSFGSSSEQSFESEDTHISTQTSSPPSLDSIDMGDQKTEFLITQTYQRRKACLQLLELIHDIRSKRTDTGETDWDPNSVFKEPETRLSEGNTEGPWCAGVTDAIFEKESPSSIDPMDIYACLKECNDIFKHTGNWHHLTLTPQSVTKLTHTLLSDDPSMRLLFRLG
ncbi:hypothetical protein BLNAU_16238 [Blattamonas nauphoetae]|uniref:Uncharacterized protein n=1 Tax=Blattamonas nauphoetae TaxID=2049346 RepID=A0ABQ9XFB8_9EUKA|nr:hypothetical protein BLNAU_16238 [Blattamonas nauphoetae]